MLTEPDRVERFFALEGEIRATEWLDDQGRRSGRPGASMARMTKRDGARVITIVIDAGDAEQRLAHAGEPQGAHGK